MSDEENRVFRIEKGALVRIPGDIRDPSRRYAAVTDLNGTYHREFTDEEEKQRDQEEFDWKAKEPEREAEKKRQEEEANRFRESLKYETRLVAFLDVLGWSQAIEESKESIEITQRLGITMQGMDSHVKMNAWQRLHGDTDGWPGDPMITHFSDSLLISFRDDEQAKSSLEMTLSSIIHQMLFNGFIVRGGVCRGPMIHKESLAYGPALITAYKLEQKADWPRIIVEQALGQTWGDGTLIVDKDGTVIGRHRPWRCFEDDWYFFDYLGNPFKMLNSVQGNIQESREIPIQLWRNLIENRLIEHSDNECILKKYTWLNRYFNETYPHVSQV